ncbi:SRPBCC family protein [Zhihengliuella flava]|uniref:Activator of HSP90 ATPase n=1 Tax=Zhihengliuella flava TaxID=1285193 RepID=A0A931DD11_9MICC|nr:hypothetical protein [Zhihengliuella flava]MBG6085211.1 hypothetical protein [Zhihengliuella flava]
MSSLFSHAEPAPNVGSSPSQVALSHQAEVPVATDRAFEGFTDYIHLWWPAEVYSKGGPGTHISLDADGLNEELDDGQVFVAAELLEAVSGEYLELRVTDGFEHLAPSRLRVTFTATVTGTRVQLVHDGFDAAHGGEQRAYYGYWAPALRRYARFMGAHEADNA